ncbi:MAG: dockerin type I repeat-containing protein [Isosphaeraceae bacterium]
MWFPRRSSTDRPGRHPSAGMHRPSRTRHRPRRRPALEPLEGRALLSTWTVGSLDDSPADGTLRWAITRANQNPDADTIVFAPGLAGTITLDSALPDLSDTIGRTDIIGPGAAILTVARRHPETPQFRIFTINADVRVYLIGLTLSYGGGLFNAGDSQLSACVVAGNGASSGGGVYNASGGSLTTTDCVISQNGADVGGGIANYGTLRLLNTHVDGNRASKGGGLFSEGSITAIGSTFSGNSVQDGFGGGIYLAGGVNILDTCSVDHNSLASLPYYSQERDLRGGGLYIENGDVVAVHVTFLANQVVGARGLSMDVWWPVHGGDVAGGAVYIASGNLLLQGSIISENSVIGGRGSDALFTPYEPGGPLNSYWLGAGGQVSWSVALVPGLDVFFWYNGLATRGGNGGAAHGGGIANGGGSVIAVSNEFSNNVAVGGEGGSAQDGCVGEYATAGWTPGRGFFEEHSLVYANPQPGAAGSGSGGAISGAMTLLQNNAFENNHASTPGGDADSMTPLFVDRFTIDQGEVERSNIGALSVQFNQDTNIPALIDRGAITSAVRVVHAGVPVLLGVDRYQYDPATYVLSIDLTVEGGGGRTVLDDGRYQLQLDTALLAAAGSTANRLNLRSIPVSTDGQVRYGFFRLLGDLDGDGRITVTDLVLERNQILGLAGAMPTIAGDINGDGVVDMSDFLALRNRLGGHV